MSEKNNAANKNNAQKSTGPKTPQGKARSRLNSTKHGGYARVCIEGEDSGRLKALFLDLVAEYKPMGFEEYYLLNEIADSIWRKNRFKAGETNAISSYSYHLGAQTEEKGDIGFAMAQDAGAYGTIPRCLAAEELMDRRVWRLFDRLRKIQKERAFCACKAKGGQLLLPSNSSDHLAQGTTSAVTDCDYPHI
jgi:hypothetical protein